MNRATMLSLIGLLALGSTASLQALAAADVTEKSVEAAEQQWTKANNTNDVALEATLLADNFIAVNLEGKVVDRDKFIAEEKATKYTHAAIEGVVVHVHGATAIATYVFTAKGTGSDGKPMDLRMRATDTWVKKADGPLQCVASVDTPLKP
jgi:ketosteroid isomerase-like protein